MSWANVFWAGSGWLSFQFAKIRLQKVERKGVLTLLLPYRKKKEESVLYQSIHEAKVLVAKMEEEKQQRRQKEQQRLAELSVCHELFVSQKFTGVCSKCELQWNDSCYWNHSLVSQEIVKPHCMRPDGKLLRIWGHYWKETWLIIWKWSWLVIGAYNLCILCITHIIILGKNLVSNRYRPVVVRTVFKINGRVCLCDCRDLGVLISLCL